MSLTLSVYRAADMPDCTNHGVSSRYDRIAVVNIRGPFEPTENETPMFLESHHSGCLRLVPAYLVGGTMWAHVPGRFMFGGNYAATSDSRFSHKCAQLLGYPFYGAVAIHDRVE